MARSDKYRSQTLSNTLYRQVTASQRRLSRGRRAAYAVGVPTARALLRLVWRLNPIVEVLGERHLHDLLEGGSPPIPVYWHQHQLFCVPYLLRQRERGLRPGFLISPSVDGEGPARLVHAIGGWVIRGSSTRTGARALRDIYIAMREQGISPLLTPDGPRGPAFEFKPGALLLSQLAGAPLVPLAFAARRAWVMRTWDRFVLPLPFGPVSIAIGEPLQVERRLAADGLQRLQQEMAARLRMLFRQARAALD